MSKFRQKPKKPHQVIPKIPRLIFRQFGNLIGKLTNWVLSRVFIPGRQGPRTAAGFVLPMVVMVVLVVTLLSTAIVIRSTDRAKNASNYRVNQVTLNASLPAIERAKKKLDEAFTDPTLPRGTPSDISIDSVLSGDRYTLGDEVRLRVAFDFGNGINTNNTNFTPNGSIQSRKANNANGLINDETSILAWRYPVDTDNNGKYDSFTLYGVFFRSPNRITTGANMGDFGRTRTPLDARTPPQDEAVLSQNCAAALGTSASLVSPDGWYKAGGDLRKSFYVYTATVPITSLTAPDRPYIPAGAGVPAQYSNIGNYEVFNGNKGFTALEYQQDRSRIPLGNNAVVYEDDLDLFSGTALRLNGRIVANSNLFAGANFAGGLRLYQVSSDESCFYEEENGKILIGGNIGYGPVGVPQTLIRLNGVTIDLFDGRGNNPNETRNAIDATNKSTNSPVSEEVAYNNQAYEERIELLVQAILDPDNNPRTPPPGTKLQRLNGTYPACRTAPTGCTITSGDPQAVKETIERRINANTLNPDKVREEELEVWFRNRTRRVPYKEIAFGADATTPFTRANVLVEYGTDRLRPPDNWIYPTQVTAGGTVGAATGAGRAGLTMNLTQLPATDPVELNNEERAGDRIIAGNNLPALWYNSSTQEFENEETEQQVGNNTKWLKSGANNPSNNDRYRKTQVQQLVDLGLTDRDGFWETEAGNLPENPLDNKGGLRIVTGAGVYLTATPGNGAPTPNMSRVVWPDWMPAIPGAATPGTALLPAPPWLPDGNGNGTLDDLNTDLVDENGNPRPFLRMRAAAVYHYRYDNDNNPNTLARPIACVSSYYDATDRNTAQNRTGLPNVSGGVANVGSGINPLPPPNQYGIVPPAAPALRQSNNGVTYSVGLSSVNIPPNDSQLLQQADLVYPNGRMVNPLLRQALTKTFPARTQAENAAIDSTLCAFQILSLRGAVAPNPVTLAGGQIPHGTIQEVAFLDGREVKQLDSDRINPANPIATYNAANRPNYDDSSYSFQPYNESQGDFIRSKTIAANVNRRSEYDLPIELRQPMEIRATAIDLDQLRKQRALAGARPAFPEPEYMLPNSGILYVSRDDALPDASDKQTLPWGTTAPPANNLISGQLADHELKTDRVSATDFWLDPTRRPNGVLLTNGKQLARAANNQFREVEKGLILATNLPVYIKAQRANSGTPVRVPSGFNIHDFEEFTQVLNPANWGNFYTRTEAQLEDDFACRAGDPRLSPKCRIGDQWRAVSILADSATLLSDNFRFGFRTEGDFDLRNNQIDNGFRNINAIPMPGGGLRRPLVPDPTPKPPMPAIAGPGLIVPAKDPEPTITTDPINSIEEQRRANGFFDNNFVTNGLSSGNGTGVFSNVPGYTNGRYVDTHYAGNGTAPLYSSYFNNFVTPVQRRDTFSEYLMETCPRLPVSECDPGADWSVNGDLGAPVRASDEVGNPFAIATHKAGTTAQPPETADLQRFSRRIAFLRQTTGANAGNLILDVQNKPIPLGIDNAGNIQCYTSGGTGPFNLGGATVNCVAFGGGPNRPRTQPNALLYRTTNTADPYGPLPATQNYSSNRRLFLAEASLGTPLAGSAGHETSQPLLVPILQIHVTKATVGGNLLGVIGANNYYQTHWLPRSNSTDVNPTAFNAILAVGDSPPRPSEFNGALSNFPRFLENWAQNRITPQYPLTIQGSFIQLKRSSYSSAPFWQLLPNTPGLNGTYNAANPNLPSATAGFFRYPQTYKANTGRNQTYEPPSRRWGFDVGLLSQLPDLFSQRFTLPPTEDPNEYYREASRTDEWIEALLCSVRENPAGPTNPNEAAINKTERPIDFCQNQSRQAFN